MTSPTNLRRGTRAVLVALAAMGLVAGAPLARAGTQAEEHLSASVVTGLQRAIGDNPVPADYARRPAVRSWLADMSRALAVRLPDEIARTEFLSTVHYEATRAGLDPQLVLGVIHHESAFRKYAVSVADARGFMQVMPFWLKLIGTPDQNLFQLRTNLRYGCTILRHYLDLEKGDVYRALGRYNGSLGRPEYPTAVMGAAIRYQPSVVSGLAVRTAATASAH
ncbi:MAG: transglycosylase SLT domain-containing protein [Betaproteobacteria bacterium]